ncbi:MAG TPA: TolC family protein [Bacteroidales bacterium]|nr:TolC family protein [Bacteroidales bacterium]HPF02628.1 TolC family protein [Bacteroidales bacterium]HPJ59086.1 TolC family protein [Bacteroidales bacterium]HPR11385.1 TolC family protein [Bacteroidales bacterium]HRW85664.1 TolC family protein [Bacteroidales bacterium]
MKRKVILILAIICPWLIHAQDTKILTLGECYKKAAATSAIAGEKDSYSAIWQLKDKNLVKGWLPSLDAGGSFVYNSEVIDISNSLGSLPVPGIADAIEPLPNEQYRLTVDINQVIYDGGTIRAARELEKADLRINEMQYESDLYKIRSQINTCYFNILLLIRQKELLNNYLVLIDRRISSMHSALQNGIILKSDIDVMVSERIKLEQQLRENEIRNTSLFKVLSDLTGSEISPETEMEVPDLAVQHSVEINRPEMDLFDLRKDQLEASLNMISSKRMPKAYGFATLGYGNPPGNNFFRDEFAPYYIIGGSLKWNIFDWNKVKNEKQIVTLQKDILDSRKEDLNDNLIRLLETKNSEILSLRSLLETDSGLIELRKRITASAESQYENGTITATELLNELNSEKQAMINYEIHKISLAMAEAEYLNISGGEIE